jgi:hypothetical protein
MGSWLRNRLSTSPDWVLTLFATLAAFSTYTCMYAFRKPFAAAGYLDGPDYLGLQFKSVLVISQVLGYMASKFIGIKVVSEMTPGRRAGAIVVLIGFAELALLLFAVSPDWARPLCLAANGLPLGMVFGLVFGVLEGRRQTEVMGLGLCASFVFASGFTKDAGRWLMDQGISEYWMPGATGLLFVPLLLLSTFLLGSVPPPTPADEAARTRREPMMGPQRRQFLRTFGPGLVVLVLVYMVLTAYRDFRDNFMADIWRDLSGTAAPSFSATETPVSIAVLALLMLLVLIKDNRKALMVNHLVIFGGVVLAGLSTWLFTSGWISAYLWLMATGFATYAAYIPFNSILFDRLIATFRQPGTVGFLIYVADAFGYLGSVLVQVYRDLGAGGLSWAVFFQQSSYMLCFAGATGIFFSWRYFSSKLKPASPTPQPV